MRQLRSLDFFRENRNLPGDFILFWETLGEEMVIPLLPVRKQRQAASLPHSIQRGALGLQVYRGAMPHGSDLTELENGGPLNIHPSLHPSICSCTCMDMCVGKKGYSQESVLSLYHVDSELKSIGHGLVFAGL